MFRIKICGLTSVEDALAACQAGADAIGLNFYPNSKRYCPPQMAANITRQVPSGVCRIGVFVNASASQIRQIATEVALDAVQLHGDESPEVAAALRPFPTLKAVAISPDWAPLEHYLRECHRLTALPRMVLVDAMHGGEFGGTGKTIDWDLLRQNRKRLGGIPLVLAGGLCPENIAQGILATHPWAVDVASGVERSPGKKCPQKMASFVKAARQALHQAALVSRSAAITV